MYSVLQVTPELNAGGVERTTIEMAEAVTCAGGLALVASVGGRLESDLRAAGGELIRLPLASKNPITLLSNANALARIAQTRNVNIIHARSRAPAWSALMAARRLKLPFVTTYHGIYNAKTPLKRWYNSVMARGDLVIANSEYTRGHVLETYKLDPARVIAIPRGVDVEVFDPARVDPAQVAAQRAAWGLQPNDPRFVLIAPARLTRWKGQLVLIEALARLARRRPGAVLTVFAGDAQGRDDYVREMETAISSGGLQSDVVIAGHVGQMATAFAASDAAAFPPTDPEAFGRGAVEAQAMRVPVIAADHGGLSETVVEGVTGLKVRPGDAAALEAAIERMLDMGSEARATMGANGRDRVCLLYTKTALQASTLQVYDKLLGAHG
jgi:glycosyltransferase involved in cell wall biosynthesis